MNYSQFILALTLWREARGVSSAARQAIACVIRNRAAKRKDRDIVAVCTAPYQFSSMAAPGDANLVKWPAVNDIQMADCLAIAGLVNGRDTTGGAIFYFTPPLTQPPKEWGNVVGTLIVDTVRFWRPEAPMEEVT